VFLILIALITAGALIALTFYRHSGGEAPIPDIGLYFAAAAIVLLPYVGKLVRGKSCARNEQV
jgi:hypothetical protein